MTLAGISSVVNTAENNSVISRQLKMMSGVTCKETALIILIIIIIIPPAAAVVGIMDRCWILIRDIIRTWFIYKNIRRPP